MKLPPCYDENKIFGIHDGVVRMNLPGLRFSNSSWPHRVKAARIALILDMVRFSLLAMVLGELARGLWSAAERYVMPLLLLGGVLIPLYRVGKKYEKS